MRCNQCDSLYINGIFTHERGCPNTNSEYDKESGEWYVAMTTCRYCGDELPETEICTCLQDWEDEVDEEE